MNTEITKRGAGRPIDLSKTRDIYLKTSGEGEQAVYTALGKGRRGPGKYMVVTVHRKVNSKNYQHGITLVSNTREVEVTEKVAAAPVATTVAVTVHA